MDDKEGRLGLSLSTWAPGHLVKCRTLQAPSPSARGTLDPGPPVLGWAVCDEYYRLQGSQGRSAHNAQGTQGPDSSHMAAVMNGTSIRLFSEALPPGQPDAVCHHSSA